MGCFEGVVGLVMVGCEREAVTGADEDGLCEPMVTGFGLPVVMVGVGCFFIGDCGDAALIGDCDLMWSNSLVSNSSFFPVTASPASVNAIYHSVSPTANFLNK